MTTRLIARATAFGMAAIVTFAMLGGVDFLAKVDTPPAGLLATAAQPKG